MGIVLHDADEKKPEKTEAILRFDENVIKRYRINYSVPQKVRFGMLPYSALEEYERQKAEYLAAKEAENNEPQEVETTEVFDEATNSNEAYESKSSYDNFSINENGEKVHNHTFWEDGETQRMSKEEFEAFMEEHSLDLGTASGGPLVF